MDFIGMDGYGSYLWTAYSIVLLVFLWNLFKARRGWVVFLMQLKRSLFLGRRKDEEDTQEEIS